DQRIVELQQRFAAGADDEPNLAADARDVLGQLARRPEVAAPGAAGADEVGVAELADGVGALCFPPRPQVAAGEPAEHRGASGVRAFALEGAEHLLHEVGHHAYLVGSAMPASANPLRRSWQASHAPHARPAGSGS